MSFFFIAFYSSCANILHQNKRLLVQQICVGLYGSVLWLWHHNAKKKTKHQANRNTETHKKKKTFGSPPPGAAYILTNREQYVLTYKTISLFGKTAWRVAMWAFIACMKSALSWPGVSTFSLSGWYAIGNHAVMWWYFFYGFSSHVFNRISVVHLQQRRLLFLERRVGGRPRAPELKGLSPQLSPLSAVSHTGVKRCYYLILSSAVIPHL